ncbi:MAG: hypothetical protein ABSD45_20130 [Terriglobia bacterium]|jgi:hypothetical protein
MKNNQNCLFWEYRQQKGNGTAIYKLDEELVDILEKLLPFDLDQMVSKEEAIPMPGGRYLLTKKGYSKFIQAAEQQGNSEIVEILQDREHYYWFRDAREIGPSLTSVQAT